MVFAYMYVCTSCPCSARGGQKRTSVPLGLGLHMVVAHHMGSGNKTQRERERENVFSQSPFPKPINLRAHKLAPPLMRSRLQEHHPSGDQSFNTRALSDVSYTTLSSVSHFDSSRPFCLHPVFSILEVSANAIQPLGSILFLLIFIPRSAHLHIF